MSKETMFTKRITRRGMLQGALGAAALAALSACAPKATPAPAPTQAPSGAEPKAEPTQPPATKAAETVTLTWMSSNLGEAQYEPVWKATIAEFEETHPNIKVEPIIVARQDAWTKFVTAAKAGQAYDVVKEDLPQSAYFGYVISIEDYWAATPEEYRNAWTEDILDAGRFRGTLYGLPTWGGTYAEMYNTEMVEKAGLDMANPPKTWDEYLTWAKALTTGDQYATAILGGPTNTTTRVLLPWIWSNGGEAYTEDVTEFTFAKDAKSLEAIEWYLDLDLEHKVCAPGAATTNYAEQTVLFAQEKIATMRNAYWARAKVVGDNPAIEEKLAVAFPPMNIDGKVTLSSLGCDQISKDCKNPDAAWEFVVFNNEKKWQVQRAVVANWMPMRTDVADDPEVAKDPMLKAYIEYGAFARGYPFACPLVEDIAANYVPKAVQAVLLGQGTAKDIFTKLDDDLTAMVQEL